MLEIGSLFGKCIFRRFSGNNGDSLNFPETGVRGNRYLNGENWGIFKVGTVQYFGEYWGQIPPKNSNFGVGTGTAFLGNLASLVDTIQTIILEMYVRKHRYKYKSYYSTSLQKTFFAVLALVGSCNFQIKQNTSYSGAPELVEFRVMYPQNNC